MMAAASMAMMTHGDDDEIRATTARGEDRLRFRQLRVADNTLGRDIEEPGNDQGDRETDCQ
jgi:hypothetical protein